MQNATNKQKPMQTAYFFLVTSYYNNLRLTSYDLQRKTDAYRFNASIIAKKSLTRDTSQIFSPLHHIYYNFETRNTEI